MGNASTKNDAHVSQKSKQQEIEYNNYFQSGIIDQHVVISTWSKLARNHCKMTDTSHIQSNQKDIHLSLNACDSMQRILFLLQFYHIWTTHKLSNKLTNKSFISIYEFIASLNKYSYHEIWNDFHHIRRNHNNDNICSYFNNSHINCYKNNCKSFERNTRDREKCRHKTYRRKLYLISNNKTEIENEETEMYYQNLLDTIHSYLLHYDSKNMILTNKFVTKLSSTETKEDSKMSDDFKTGNEYGFGIGFTYIFKHWPHYCPTKYLSLKQELLQNKIYALDLFEFNLLLKAAENYMKTKYCKNMKANNEDVWNEYLNIPIHTPITCDHIFVLMSYTNHDPLQKRFKTTYRKIYPSETRQQVVKRHQEIANWAQLIFESIYMYANISRKDTKTIFYHGIDSKLKFTQFQVGFLIPTSTTINRQIGYNFASSNGIVICMKPTITARHLNVSYLSDFPKEEERIIFNNMWQFCDILCNGISNAYYIKCLTLYQNLINGQYVTHNTELFKIKYQKTLVQMMNNYMNMKQNKEIKYTQIPAYLQSLFNYCCDTLKAIWINEYEFNQFIVELKQFITDIFAPFLKEIYNIKMKNVAQKQFYVTQKQLEKLLDGKTHYMCDIKCDLDHILYTMDKKYVMFNLLLERERNELMLNFEVVEKPDQITRLEFEFDCKEKEFSYYTSSKEQFTEDSVCSTYRLSLMYNIDKDKRTETLENVSELCFDIVIRVISCTDRYGNENNAIKI